MRKIFHTLLIILLILPSCIMQKKIITRSLGELPEGEVPNCIYALPVSNVSLSLTLEQEYFVPGPYSVYAEKLLGIEGVSEQPFNRFTLLNATISSYQESDPSQYFGITGNTSAFDLSELLQLKSEGYILEPLLASGNTVLKIHQGETPEMPYFSDISIKDHYREKTDTLFKTILEDSVLIRIPVYRKIRELKTEEERAEEIAHQIHKLRKRRLKMISADYPVLQEGEAMQASIDALSKVEENYLALFTGRVFTDTLSWKWDLTPDPQFPGETELCRFSETDGILPAGAESGQAVLLVVQPLEKTSKIPAVAHSGSNVIFYRIPDLARIELKLGVQTICSRRLPVYQFGKIVPLGIPKK